MPPKEKNSKLQNDQISVYMQETDPMNPYGPNYEELPQSTKIYYKFNKVKKYVHFSKHDEELILNANYKFMYHIFGSLALGIFLSYSTKQFLWRPFAPKLHEYIADYKGIYYGLITSSLMTYAYFSQTEGYINDVCYPLLLQYTQQAVDNGFEDYKISDYRQVDMEQIIKSKRQQSQN